MIVLSKKEDKIRIENNVKKMDSYQNQATFNSIKINVSSRMSLMYLSFSLQVRQHGHDLMLGIVIVLFISIFVHMLSLLLTKKKLEIRILLL